MKPQTPQELVKLAVEQKLIQQYLYKYRKIDSNLEKILINNEMWFSSPIDFNDPFDCQIKVDTNNNYNEIFDFLKKNLVDLSIEEIGKISSDLYLNPEKWDNFVNQSSRETINSNGICCFCSNFDNILLWSHYADNHKGICLKFDVLKDLDFFVYPLNIIYQRNYPVFNYLKNKERLTDFLIKTKSDDWSYEREVRVLKFEKGLHSFRKAALVEIIFGCKTTDLEIDRIKSLVSSNGYAKTTFKMMKTKDAEFGLDIIEI